MSRRTRLLLVGLAVLLVGGWWTSSCLSSDDATTVKKSGARHRKVGPGLKDALAKSGARAAKIPWTPRQRDDGAVTITGTVIDARSAAPVPGVEVVFRSAAGEESTTAGADGTYRLDLPAGVYRAFVRDDSVLSVGRMDQVRLPGAPVAETAGVPDEALMPLVVASRDADGVDLSVVRGGSIAGRVVDREGRPIANAVLRAHGNFLRPTLGTDIAETDAAGTFEMRLPSGEYALEASHPHYAGVQGAPRILIDPGDVAQTTVTLTAGCVISGRVIASGGRAANEGAIEKQWGDSELQFAPSGRIGSDGTFRWSTTEEIDVVLRAWPWKSPPSPSRRFSCKDGARFDNVVFALPDRGPDIEGVLLDHSGAPVPFAHVDLAPLDSGGIAQQERTDAEGKWAVFQMPAGRYSITAFAPSRGIVTTTVTSPQTGVRLTMSGTGRLEGTTTLLANGSFEMMLGACLDGATVPLSKEQRLVSVSGGRFSVDDVPACDLQFVAVWHGQPVPGRVTVPAGGVGRIDLAIGPPRKKIVTGIVRDMEGRAVAAANVHARTPHGSTSAIADGSGRYSIETYSGATLAAQGPGVGYAEVGMANVDREQVDITITDSDSGDHWGGDLPDDPEPDDPAPDSVH